MPPETPEYGYRAALFAVILCAVAMSGYYRRRADRAGGAVPRRGDGRFIGTGLVVTAVAGMGGVVVYLVHPAWMAWSRIELPAEVRLAGVAVAVALLPFLWWVLRSLGHNITPTPQTRANHTLVTHGPYRLVRHPLYTGGLLGAASYAVVAANWFIMLAVVLGAIVIAIRTRREEANLIARFGDEYRAYQRRTGRLLPRPWPRG